jgi:hypothetical protein
LTTDLDGNDRFVDGDGNGATSVDMGVYEFAGGAPSCPGDVTNDGLVSVEDLIAVILDWGCTAPPGPCGGDANGDGVVDVQDMVSVVLAWGACM